MKKTAITLAGLALALSGLVACGGSDDDGGGGIPSDASKDDFCNGFQTLGEDLAGMGADTEPADAIKALKDAADKLRETGVPSSASDDEREGLEVTLDAIDGLDEDSSLDDISGLDDTLSDSDQEKADAFDDYLEKECGDL